MSKGIVTKIVLLGALAVVSCKDGNSDVAVKENTPEVSEKSTFTNPLKSSGADPYSWYKDGYYYYTNTLGNKLAIWKIKDLSEIGNAEMKVIWTPPENTMYSRNIWAPQVQFLEGKWYMYFAADDGDNQNHRMYVLENSSEDPMTGEWEFKGKVAAPSDKWAIDADIYEFQDQLYMIWSGWEGDENGRQDIFIAKMSNPYTIEGKRIKISSPTFDWERNYGNGPEVLVNEGPQFLEHGENLFIVFSASGCWTDNYSLGLLKLTGDDLLDAENWEKDPEPYFLQSPENGVYGPGHNSFFKSPDGTEDWILYHANPNSGDGCGGNRSPRMQKITWNADGTPDFGTPVAPGTELELPSGTSEIKNTENEN